MNQEMTEHLIKCSQKILKKENEYRKAKQELEILRAKYVLLNDWESLIGKKKPTVIEKQAYIDIETETQKRNVDELKLEVEYCKRIYEINLISYQEVDKE